MNGFTPDTQEHPQLSNISNEFGGSRGRSVPSGSVHSVASNPSSDSKLNRRTNMSKVKTVKSTTMEQMGKSQNELVNNTQHSSSVKQQNVPTKVQKQKRNSIKDTSRTVKFDVAQNEQSETDDISDVGSVNSMTSGKSKASSLFSKNSMFHGFGTKISSAFSFHVDSSRRDMDDIEGSKRTSLNSLDRTQGRTRGVSLPVEMSLPTGEKGDSLRDHRRKNEGKEMKGTRSFLKSSDTLRTRANTLGTILKSGTKQLWKAPSLLSSEKHSHRKSIDSMKEDAQETCPICIEDVEKKLMKSVIGCKHLFCAECFLTHLKFEVFAGRRSGMRCPYPGCKTIMKDNFLRRILSKDDMDQLEVWESKRRVQNNPTLFTCLNQECSTIFTWDGDRPLDNDNPYMLRIYFSEDSPMRARCPECKLDFCLNCHREPFHVGSPCRPGDVKRAHPGASGAMDDLTRDYLNENVSRCRNCHRGILRRNSSPVVSCVCGYVFCLDCGAENGACACDVHQMFYRRNMARLRERYGITDDAVSCFSFAKEIIVTQTQKWKEKFQERLEARRRKSNAAPVRPFTPTRQFSTIEESPIEEEQQQIPDDDPRSPSFRRYHQRQQQQKRQHRRFSEKPARPEKRPSMQPTPELTRSHTVGALELRDTVPIDVEDMRPHFASMNSEVSSVASHATMENIEL